MNRQEKVIRVLNRRWAHDRRRTAAPDFKTELFGLHFAADRLWLAVQDGMGDDEMRRRVGNVLICAILVSQSLGIDGADGVIDDRLRELRKSDWPKSKMIYPRTKKNPP